MRMSTGLASARLIGTAGRGVAWAFFVPITVISIWAIDGILNWTGSATATTEGSASLATALGCFVLWYFVVGRVPNWIAVRNVRSETSGAALVYGADVFTQPRRSLRFVARFEQAGANAVVFSASGIQLWGGKRDDIRPIATWDWAQVGTIAPHGGGMSPFISIQMAGGSVPLMVSIVQGRVFAFTRLRGRARARLIARIETLRTR